MSQHDKLQSEAHIYLWNNFPHLRQLFHSNFNDIKVVESVLRATTGQSIGSARAIIISKLKALGLVTGVFDHELLYRGQLYFFDTKILPDTLSPEQITFKKVNENHGAKCFTYSTIEEFKEIIQKILR